LIARHGGDGPVSVTERYLVVRRSWSFVVVRISDGTSFFNEDSHYFDEVVGGLSFMPEPPGNPALLAIGCLAAVLGAAAFGARRLISSRTGRR
jgi:hypothetical protein